MEHCGKSKRLYNTICCQSQRGLFWTGYMLFGMFFLATNEEFWVIGRIWISTEVKLPILVSREFLTGETEDDPYPNSKHNVLEP